MRLKKNLPGTQEKQINNNVDFRVLSKKYESALNNKPGFGAAILINRGMKSWVQMVFQETVSQPRMIQGKLENMTENKDLPVMFEQQLVKLLANIVTPRFYTEEAHV